MSNIIYIYIYFKAWKATFNYKGFDLDMNNDVEYECYWYSKQKNSWWNISHYKSMDENTAPKTIMDKHF